MAADKSKHYIDNSRLVAALVESQQLGHPTEEVCRYFMLIAEHLLRDHRFRGYPRAMKEDLASDALLKSIKNIKNFKVEYAEKAFGYFTRCIEQEFFKSLGKHYKQENIKRDQMEMYLESLRKINADEAEYFERQLLKRNTTGIIKSQEG